MPKVSVIVPIYNTERYLPACLDALLAQTVRNIEIFAVDNGCTDGSGAILKDYAARDGRVRVINKAHGDIYTARNAALRSANGEWIAFCDSDDTLPPRAYEHLLRRTERTACDVVVGSFAELDESGAKMPRTLTRMGGDGFKTLMTTPCVWNKLIRREFLLQHGLEFPPVPIEDVIFLAKLLRRNPRIERVQKTVYYYWQHYSGATPSLSYRYTPELFKGLIQSHHLVYEELKDTPYRAEAEEYVYCALASSLKDFLPRIWDSGERQECFERFRDHLLSIDWSGREERFFQIFEIPLSNFRTISAQSYMRQLVALDHRKAVLAEYRAGTIGFQYILAYFEAWLGFKAKKYRAKIQKSKESK